jgi:hypothetical protein
MRRRHYGPGPPRTPLTLHGQTGVSQVTGSSSSNVPRSATPPRETPPRPLTVASPTAFRVFDLLGFPGRRISGLYPAAHLFACLRINRPVTVTAARLATDLRGWTLIGRDSHPLDDKPNFLRLSHSHSFRTSIAWPDQKMRSEFGPGQEGGYLVISQNYTFWERFYQFFHSIFSNFCFS